MARLNGTVKKAAAGLVGFDSSEPITKAASEAFHQKGYSFCIRYLSRSTPQGVNDLSMAEGNAILASGLALMAVQHVMLPGWVPSAARGTQYGTTAVTNAKVAGLPRGVTLWLDLEGIGNGTAGEDVVVYCNNWFEVVASAGYEAGVYVGANCVLDGNDLYWRIKTQHYWRSGSKVPDLPHRGYQLIQRITTTPDVVNDVEIDRNITVKDEFGDTVSWLAS